MDEFCANKDSQLKRCACSSRINEFNSTKQNLANVEDKLLDFSQRLLTVNMDKEDALAMNQATAGELAFAAEDTSESKKMLDEIAKKLNTSFNDSNFDQGLNAISLSLNTDAAFDSIDSMAGASTTTKSGTDLYVSALPVCREMALEVCSPDDLAIAESSYQMVIEQDCNTVKKSYQTQVDQARTKVFESGALLDMSRLDIHQKRNSDDILTCKRKMLDMLTDSTVCGDGLGKCLDTTGRYIDPTTGTAFLTTELHGLSQLITRPESGQTWTTAPGNDRFVTFLNSKKKFLEPAMENCQDISDYVWDSFLDDALSQIKLAQESKLEEMRQSCTTLTTQCLDETFDSISKFDARALSIFGVTADATVNTMCTDVRTACTALMETSGGAADWESGMTDIATEKTYETIMQTCREVGRACIIQACTSITGNFGLCENIDTSINRKSILNRNACWDEVVNCVASAGNDAITAIQNQHKLDKITNNTTYIATVADTESDETTTPPETGQGDHRPAVFRTFYSETYGMDKNSGAQYITLDNNGSTTNQCISGDNTQQCIYDICADECAPMNNTGEEQYDDYDCYVCRLAERIWGNCEVPPNTQLSSNTNNHNKIRIPQKTDGTPDTTGTLLAWFAANTGTESAIDNCRDTSCPPGYVFTNTGKCTNKHNTGAGLQECGNDTRIDIYANDSIKMCCNSNITDAWGNCCDNANSTITATNNTFFGTKTLPTKKVCTTNAANLMAQYTHNSTTYYVVCTGDVTWTGDATNNYPNGTDVACDGNIAVIANNNGYYNIINGTDTTHNTYLYSDDNNSTPCFYNNNNGQWELCNPQNEQCNTNGNTPHNWSITYGDICITTRA